MPKTYQNPHRVRVTAIASLSRLQTSSKVSLQRPTLSNLNMHRPPNSATQSANGSEVQVDSVGGDRSRRLLSTQRPLNDIVQVDVAVVATIEVANEECAQGMRVEKRRGWRRISFSR